MGTRIFVGNLSYGSSEAALRTHFEQAGFDVRSVRIISDRETGRSRGFGFCELEGEGEARRAIEQLDGSELEGRRLALREAHDRKDGGGGPRDGGRPSGPRPGGRFEPREPIVVERVGGDGRRGPSGFGRGAPRPDGPPPGPGFTGAPPEPGWAKSEGRRNRKFDGKKGGRRHDADDDDSDW